MSSRIYSGGAGACGVALIVRVELGTLRLKSTCETLKSAASSRSSLLSIAPSTSSKVLSTTFCQSVTVNPAFCAAIFWMFRPCSGVDRVHCELCDGCERGGVWTKALLYFFEYVILRLGGLKEDMRCEQRSIGGLEMNVVERGSNGIASPLMWL